ncbi:hypothetical protein [Clostridium intestinale]|uniref:Viral A-type inclusion protein n=1 Tax=Clostridium intestinale URNW TaxID=1294142 RepID=U2PR77_9CLOT|nr:hypothetical protein [Clostridium intestinale]ERK28940.1 hypothetical protein CINTURNW_3809 [Clostridium intestinale URNW]
MGFLKRNEIKEKEVPIMPEPKVEVKEIEPSFSQKKSLSQRRNLSLFEGDTVKYLIENFPTMSIGIQNGLNNLADILEDTINYIEDRSSEIIKKNREFTTSQEHRDTAIAIYDVVQNINNYVSWMQDEYESNMRKEAPTKDSKVATLTNELKEESVNTAKEASPSQATTEEQIEIYKDFSLKDPKGFTLHNHNVLVEDWDDLLVKTAAILTKQYRSNKNSNKIVKNIQPLEKKSTQNSFRDTVIEMLTEYKINLDEFKIIIKNK